MFIVATFEGPEARASKTRTPGRISVPVPRWGNAGGPTGAVETIEAGTDGGMAGSTGCPWFPRFNRTKTLKTSMPIAIATHGAPFLAPLLAFEAAPFVFFFGVPAETSFLGTGARGGSTGAGSASPYRSSGSGVSGASFWLPVESDGTVVWAPHCLQRTFLPANLSSALNPLPHWGQLKEMGMIRSITLFESTA